MKRTIISVLALFLLAFMYACNNDSTMNSSDEYYNSDLAILDQTVPISDVPLPVIEATMDNDMSMAEIMGGDDMRGDRGDKGRMGNMGDMKHGMMGLGRILYNLNLTDDQKAKVRECMTAFHSCVKEAMQNLREQIKPIMEAANAERREILAKLKSGEITREEARDAIKAINDRVKQAIRNLHFNEAYCNCLHQLFRCIAGTLDVTQLAKFEEWIATLKGPCFPDAAGE